MIGQVQFGPEIPSNQYSFTVKRSVRINRPVRMSSEPRRSTSVACLVNGGLGLIIGGSMLIGFGSMAKNSALGGFIFYTLGAALLILAVCMCAIGIIVFCKRSRDDDTENNANGHEMNPTVHTISHGQDQSAVNGSADPTAGPGNNMGRNEGLIANQARQDLPPSYRSSRLFVTISDVPESIEEEEQEAPHSPPPSYVDVCTDSNAPV